MGGKRKSGGAILMAMAMTIVMALGMAMAPELIGSVDAGAAALRPLEEPSTHRGLQGTSRARWTSPQVQTVRFPAPDGLPVTADLYAGVSKSAPVIVLFHQSASSRGEFRDTAPRLQALGYNAIAVDLRWGGERNGVVNETAERNGTSVIMAAVEDGTGNPWPTIDDSFGDMVATLDWLETEGYVGPRFVLGSSFSAMLVFRLAAEDDLAGVVAFSPGEYDGARPELVRGWVSSVTEPVLTVAGPGEDFVSTVADSVTSQGSAFHRAYDGVHGASILDVDETSWRSLTSFLGQHAGGPPCRVESTIPGPGGEDLHLDRYDGFGERGVIVLFHQALGSARGEYGFLVSSLLELGFDVVAPDLPGGGDRFGSPNRTLSATPQPEDFGYCDARPWMRAVIEDTRKRYTNQPITLWGSSYSAALVLHAAAEDESRIARVLAFSPASGEPMAGCDANSTSSRIRTDVLVVRPEREMEIDSVRSQIDLFRADGHATHVATPGVHGSSALNPVRVGGDVTPAWERVRAFLLGS